MSDKIEYFPDGTPVDKWFYEDENIKLENLGKQYDITDYGVKDDGSVQTDKIQNLIDEISKNGGGVLVVPSGTFITGALFFKKGVNLYVCKGGVIKGSDNITDYPLMQTRIEGETCIYYPALINADSVDNFKMFGDGVIDGNGEKSWYAFWLRLKWNPNATNKDEQRPRLIYISNSNNVFISGLTLQNSHFWTCHIYKCQKVRFINCEIKAPRDIAPSSDAIDIDACIDVHVKNCLINVNDDAIVLKGGKGPWADIDENNGPNERVVVEDCIIEYAHACLTCGSESIYNKNILVNNIKIIDCENLFRLKMRPDTPQKFEFIQIRNVSGTVRNFILAAPYRQFFDLKGRQDMPVSYAENITIKDCDMDCTTFFNVESADEQYKLLNFNFENLKINTKYFGTTYDTVKGMTVNNVTVKIVGNK